jgi:hypothetical protein
MLYAKQYKIKLEIKMKAKVKTSAKKYKDAN